MHEHEAIDTAELDPLEAGKLVNMINNSDVIKKSLAEIPGKSVLVVNQNVAMNDPKTIEQKWTSICFFAMEQSPNHLISLQGMPAVLLDDADRICIWTDLRLLPNEYDEFHFDSQKGGIEQTEIHKIIATYSIDTEGISNLSVVVIEQTEKCYLETECTPSIDSFPVTPSSHFDGVNEWREVFLKKLKDPKADTIIKEIKKTIKILSNDSTNTAEKVVTMELFYENVKSLMRNSNSLWGEEVSKEEIEGSIEVIERYIFGKCFSHVYQPMDSDDASQDRIFNSHCQELEKKITFQMVSGVVTDDEAIPDLDKFIDASDALSQTCLVESPIVKLELLKKFVKLTADHSSDKSSDLLIPLMVWLVLKNPPISLISDIRYIERFRERSKLTGETAYCLTSIIAVVTMIENLHVEHVSNEKDTIHCLANLTFNTPVKSPEEIVKTTTTTSDLNSMATTVFNTIGFVPKAIGSAVVDTFRSRSARSSQPNSIDPSLAASPATTQTPLSKTLLIEAKTPEHLKIRERVRSTRRTNSIKFTDLTVQELQYIYEDYMEIISFHSAI